MKMGNRFNHWAKSVSAVAALGLVASVAWAGAPPVPVVQWTFDEASGNALDTGSGVATDGTLTGLSTRSTDTPGTAGGMSLDTSPVGTDNTVNGGNSAEVDTLTQFTLVTWVKVEGANNDPAHGGSGNVRLIAKQNAGLFDGISWNLNAPNAGDYTADNFRMGLFVGGTNSFGAFQADADITGLGNQWILAAVTYDGTQTVDNAAFYFGTDQVGGDMQQLGSLGSMDSGQVFSTGATADFGIGFTDAAPGLDFSNLGKQDDMRVYDSVLSLADLENIRTSVGLVAGTIPGDADCDGDVDLDDFNILAANFGQVGTVGKTVGDFDGDSDTDLDDFNILAANFGTGPEDVGNLPEPGSLALLSLGTLAVLRRRA